MKMTLSLRFLGFLSGALCANVAACGGSTFSPLEADGGGTGSPGSSSGAGSGGSSSGSTGSSSGASSGGLGSSGSSGSSSGTSSSSSSSGSGSSSGNGSGSSSGSSSGGASDAGPGPFSCGPTLTCDGETTYCAIRVGGAVLVDGGANETYSCTAFPLKCFGNHTCSCVATSAATQCSESGGDVTATTEVP